MSDVHVWEIRNPDGGASGLEFARGKMRPSTHVLAHALPETVDVEVRDAAGTLFARGEGLRDPAPLPMARLTIEGGKVARRNLWPEAEDIGRPVILCGGEVGILTAWWNASDGSEWRWSIELHNRR